MNIFKYYISFFLLSILIVGTRYKTDNDFLYKETIYLKKLEKSLVMIENNLYVSKYEVTNIEYNIFLGYLQKTEQQELYKQCLYDSTKWDNSSYTANYHKHSAYSYYPVVNITYEAAINYCKWITEQYNKYPNRKFKKVVFRLPEDHEWIKAVNPFPGEILPWHGSSVCNEKKKFYANVTYRDYTQYSKKENKFINGIGGGSIPAYVFNFPQNKNGICNIIGSVSEMLLEKGKQKGGNWSNFIEECGVDKTQEIEVPDPKVGFRIFMEVI